MPLTEVKPYWTSTSMPHFNTRTSTIFNKMPLGFLKSRGINNKLFESLVAGLPDGAAIAGGFMVSVIQRDTKASDIDIFFTNEQAFKNTYNQLKNPPSNDELWAWRGYSLDPNIESNFEISTAAFRFVKFTHPTQPPIQLIKLLWYHNYGHIIDSFDFTLTQFAATKNNIYFNPVSFYDLCRKQIVLHRLQFPASTLRRLIKYVKKGYFASKESLIAIAKQSADAVAQAGGEVLEPESGPAPFLEHVDFEHVDWGADPIQLEAPAITAPSVSGAPATPQYTATWGPDVGWSVSDGRVVPETYPVPDTGAGPSPTGSMY